MDHAHGFFRLAEPLLGLFILQGHALVYFIQMNLQSSRVWFAIGHFVRLVGVVVLLAGFPMDELLRAHRLRWRALIIERGAGSHRAHRTGIVRINSFIGLVRA